MKESIREVKLTLAFKIKNPDTGFFGKAICFLTKSKIYHVELIIDDLWISADSPMGVTINPLQPEKHEYWEYVNLGTRSILERDYEIIMEYIKNMKNRKYDYLGIIFSQLFPFRIHDHKKLFCSEIVIKILKLFLVKEVLELVPQTISPKDLAKIFGLEK